jgi:hypothetical protein
MATSTVNVTPALSTRKFPHPYRFSILPLEIRKRHGAITGIRDAEHMIGHYTEEIEILTARGPHEDKDFEEDRLDSLNIFRNTIASHQRKLAEHRKMLATLPPEK